MSRRSRSYAALRVVFIILVAFWCAWPAAAQRQTQIRRAREPLRGQYIVVLEGGAGDAEAVGLESAAVYGGRLKHVFRRSARGFAIETSATAAAALARDPRVKYVEEDGVVRASEIQLSPTWGLDRIDQHPLPLDSSYTYPVAGTLVYVHVIDTGIRPTHTEFGGRAFIAGDYVDDDGDGNPFDVGNDDGDPTTPDGADCDGHGTHVAGTIGGSTYGVAKTVAIYAYRVLDCDGYGSTSGVMAAIDAVALDPRRPAVANMSLGGGPSAALDDAVRDAIAAGITFTVAAGNDNIDAVFQSPARVAEAITVGATTSTDSRSSFSNVGTVLDLFAPGSSIRSAWLTSDTDTAVLSGTSMAAPHAAGVAALYLQVTGNRTPAEVRDALVAEATPGVVTDLGPGSPNRLLYSGLGRTIPVVRALQPNGGERLFTGTPYLLTWSASDPDGVTSMDVLVSTDGGVTYAPIPSCTNLAGTMRECLWAAPGPATSKARIKVVAHDANGDDGVDISDANATIVSGAATVTMKTPNTGLAWAVGSIQTITWSHNVGANAFVRLQLSRDGGATFPETIVDSVKNTSSSSGSYAWQVTSPVTALAVVRVRWLPGGVSDTGNVPFTIVEPFLTLSTPSASANWGYGTMQRVTWKTNLSGVDLVDVILSTDNGATFPVVLASDIPASAKRADVIVPTLQAATSQARIRVVWKHPPPGLVTAATNPAAFTVAPAFVTLTSPNGGESWAVGTQQTVRWTSNLGTGETVLIALSLDGGATFTTAVLASTPSDGKQVVTIAGAWASPTARIRVTWSQNASVSDTSNSSFSIP